MHVSFPTTNFLVALVNPIRAVFSAQKSSAANSMTSRNPAEYIINLC